MRLVIDANVLMSALVTDSAVRKAVRTTADDLYTPWYVRTELARHRDEIRAKSGLSMSAFDGLVENLFRHVETVPQKKLIIQSHEAAREMRRIDADDAFYVAAALAVDGAVVSNDPHLDEQRAVPHLWTSEFVERALGDTDEDNT